MDNKKQTIGIFFFPRKTRVQKGKWPLYIRITVDSERREFSLKEWIDASSWDETRGKAKGNRPEAKELNTYLEQVRCNVMDRYREFIVENRKVTAELLKRRFLGLDANTQTLMGLLEYHNTNMQGKLAEGTLKNYRSTARYVLKFLKERKKRADIYLTELDYRFLLEFEQFVRATPLKDFDPCHNNGLMKHIERLRKIANLGVKLGWLQTHPFLNYRLTFQKHDRQFLDEQELKALEACTLRDHVLDLSRDLFVFSCYTGLAPVDLSQLGAENVVRGGNGDPWLHFERKKTGTIVDVPLLPKAQILMEKYRNHPISKRRGTLFPVPTNQQVNRSLKMIAEICNIDKYLTFYLSRHTFATTVTLNNGVPLETVSRMMGHTKFSTTQIYAKVLNRKVGEDMVMLKKKLFP